MGQGRGRRLGSAPDGAKLSPVQGLRDRVYDVLRAQIFDRRLIAGARLNVDQIARELQVSPTPVREAVNRMMAEGLAVYEPYSGYTVAPPLDLDGVEKLHEVRRLIESFAARVGAPRASDELIARMDAQTREMEALAAEPGYVSFKNFDKCDNDFHDLIVAGAGNPFLTDSYAGLSGRNRMVRVYYVGGPTDMRAVIREHQRVLDSFVARDGEAAAAALEAHLGEALKRLAVMIEQFAGETRLPPVRRQLARMARA